MLHIIQMYLKLIKQFDVFSNILWIYLKYNLNMIDYINDIFKIYVKYNSNVLKTYQQFGIFPVYIVNIYEI